MKKLMLLVSGVVLLAGCVQQGFTPTGATQYPPWGGPVQVFYGQPQGVRYEQIGIVSAKGGGRLVTTADIIASLQVRAAAAGGNAIIMAESREETQAGAAYHPQVGYMAQQRQSRELTALAIRVLE